MGGREPTYILYIIWSQQTGTTQITCETYSTGGCCFIAPRHILGHALPHSLWILVWCPLVYLLAGTARLGRSPMASPPAPYHGGRSKIGKTPR